MGSEAVAAVQARIDAQQDYDALVYGLRNLGGTRYEVQAAIAVAERLLGQHVGWSLDGWDLKRAKKLAKERLDAASEAVKAIGTKRQLRLALKEVA